MMRQRHILRRVIGQPNDAGVVFGCAFLMPELELLQPENIASGPASQPVRGSAAQTAQSDHDVFVFGAPRRHAYSPPDAGAPA